MILLCIDPGPETSGVVAFDGNKVLLSWAEYKNTELINEIPFTIDHVAIEMIASYGMAVGAEVFETCVWIGRLMERAHVPTSRITRHQVKNHICHNMSAKDSNIRQAIIDRFGGKDRAIGGRKCPKCKGKGWFGAGRPACPECGGSKWKFPPGPLHGVSSHAWAALAVGITWFDRQREAA